MNNSQSSSFSQSMDIYFRGAFSIDIVLINYDRGGLQVLLQRKNDFPGENKLGLPGKLILPNEEVDEAMKAFISKILGTDRIYKRQLYAFSKVDRHPLGRVVSFGFYGLIASNKLSSELSEDLDWFPLDAMPSLAFDHEDILKLVLNRLKVDLTQAPLVFELLPRSFILSDIIRIYEQIFGQKIDSANFRKQLKKSELLVPTNKYQRPNGGIGRPAQKYRFERSHYEPSQNDIVHFNF